MAVDNMIQMVEQRLRRDCGQHDTDGSAEATSWLWTT